MTRRDVRIGIHGVLGAFLFAAVAQADLGARVTGGETDASSDRGYAAAAERTLAQGGNVLFLSDLHLKLKAGRDGKLELDTTAPSYLRLERVKAFLRANPGKVVQIVWLGDTLDAAGPKAISDRIALMESVVKGVADAAALPVGPGKASDTANHLFLMGNHDVPAEDALYDAAEKKYQAEKAAYDRALARFVKGEGTFPGSPPHPLDRDEFDDPNDTRRVLESWRQLGYVVTERPGDVRSVLLKGFDRPELGRRNKVMLSHYPVGVGGDLQVLPSSDPRTLDKLARQDRDVRLGGDDVFARIFGDIHTPRRIEEPIVELEHGRLVRKQNPGERNRTYLVADPGSLAERRGTGTNERGERVTLDPSFGLLSPTDGFFHYRVTDTGTEPYTLPASQRSFGIPTGPINRDPAKARLFDRAYGAVREDGRLRTDPVTGRIPLPIVARPRCEDTFGALAS